MKVIFLKDVPKVGKRYQVKEVSDGYAINFLFPKSLAKIATAGTLKDIEFDKEMLSKRQKKYEENLNTELNKLTGSKIEIEAKANEKGILFAGIDREEIMEAIRKGHNGANIDPDLIILEKPIKEIGDHKVKIRFGNKEAFVTINVIKHSRIS